MDKDSHDSLYSEPKDAIKKFVFDDSVADVFPNMIERSVPGYGMTISMIGLIAHRFAKPNTVLYDLGCSLGAATVSMMQSLEAEGCRVVGVDNSQAMIERCRQNLQAAELPVPFELVCKDLQNVAITNASVVVLNFTLQFVPAEDRCAVLKSIASGMVGGGVLILSEKVQFESESEQSDITEMHHDFKAKNGYSRLEIAQKRTSLENVLIPETIDSHQARLKDAGFSRSYVWFQCFNFVSFVAIK